MHRNSRTFDRGSHDRFARISCDFNPVHMDPIAARRTHLGAPIVHGIHSLLWILECISKSPYRSSGASRLKAQFLQPVYVGDDVSLEISQSPQGIRARLMVGPEDALVASLSFEERERATAFERNTCPPCLPPPDRPGDISLEEMNDLTGCLSVEPMLSTISTLFPSAVETFGLATIGALACSSCLVGMVVPGLHSMYSGLDVSLSVDHNVPAETLQFAVVSVVPRFRAVRIAIWGRGLRGSLETINRTPPVRQPSVQSLLPLVSRNEFLGSTALVVGGSRGLGELTSKLIAVGGGKVVITYATGLADANAVVTELKAAGLSCSAISYDIHKPPHEQLTTLDVAPTHLYYFATPLIFRRKAGPFDAARFSEFSLFYLTAFYDLVQACSRLSRHGINAFYPSSSFIDSRPAGMTEYAMSKAAAEILCADITKFVPGVRILTRRLPRLPTDQTSSIVNMETANAVEVILPIVREMNR